MTNAIIGSGVGCFSSIQCTNMRLCMFHLLFSRGDEANVSSHVVYTIPVAVLLTVGLWPLCTRLDLYKIIFLITVAFTYTIPW